MLSVVIPALNEEAVIGAAVGEIKTVLREANIADFEILVVDDGSTDRTATLAAESGAIVVSNLQNMGYGFSLKKGIGQARHDIIVTIDADGTYPIKEIPALVQKYQEGYHMVVAARSGVHYWGTALKRPMRLFLGRLVEYVTGERIPDVNSGLRVFSRRQSMAFFDQLSNKFSFSTSITLIYLLNQLFIEYMPIDYAKRVGESKVRLFRDSLRTLQYIVNAVVYYNPIKLFILLAAVPALVTLGCFAAAAIFASAVALWAGIGALMVGLLIAALGLLGVLIQQLLLPSSFSKSAEMGKTDGVRAAPVD